MADLRPQWNEEGIGANHPTMPDVINRAWNVEHNEDGTHKYSGGGGGGGIGGNSVGTGALKSATGSASGSISGGPTTINIALSDYAFAPSITQAGTVADLALIASMMSDPMDTVARLGVQGTTETNCVYTVRWRYMTASDDPTIWVVHDSAGRLMAVWAADDELGGERPAVTVWDASMQAIGHARRLKSEHLAALSLPPEALAKADEQIARRRLRKAHRCYRALQHHAGDAAPARWILEHCQLVGGHLHSR
jgi:hypothetical protein